MNLFYQKLLGSERSGPISKAEALRQAQLAFIENENRDDYNDPYYWAPFILLGNWL
jgi:CHAT domain-containing protein